MALAKFAPSPVPNSTPLHFVVGHKRPDADATVSACVAARLLARTRPGAAYQALLQGDPGPQAKWLFARAGLPLPPIRDDVRPTAGEAAIHPEVIRADTPLGEALDRLSETNFSLLPVVDHEGHFIGAVGPAFPENRYLYHFNLEDFVGALLEIPDLPRGLRLVPLNVAAASPSAGGHGSFVLHGHARPLQAGDVVLGSSRDAVTSAHAAVASAVILADCKVDEARSWVGHVALPVWHYPGSLLALISELPRAIPCGRVMNTQCPTASPDDRLEDLRPLFLRTPHALPVLDPQRRLLGIVSRREALQPPRHGLILVDHFERSQTVRGYEACEIVEIIDHHRVGSIETLEPARVDCRPLGSTATILALRFEEAGLEPEPAEALLLLGALVSDTLLLTSPTTTDVDRRLAPRLAARAGVELAVFGREVLAQNDGLATESADDLVNRDLKEFSHGETRFLLGQIETVDLGLLTSERRAALKSALERARAQAGAAFALTMVTDVLGSLSELVPADPDSRRTAHLLAGGDTRRAGLVSRKKQLVPLVLARLAEWRG
ncbi:MAG TPA: CBS domain-containing protein [Opitutaceae bacterium]